GYLGLAGVALQPVDPDILHRGRCPMADTSEIHPCGGRARPDVRCPARFGAIASTTLADLLRPPLVANPFSPMRASLRRESSEEFEDGVAYGGQSWLRRRPVDSFFPALPLRAGDAGGRRKRSSS